ncbi:hypothetical protein TpMuguga_03g00863 [Theileria parva strain Muguga]|uniref:SfiI-subtelomeric related protein family member n=1 Tax=Theileria parva TaxID=5875 RepID=Q4MYH7_THEPA|nr:uncharacterized protein TpMuguga_03g00863 [Theileria parva strain Muguga]EAN30705.1 hypothetical protein TpMuguga_03g00863 [Theileria parva strain Muguga]|eukprot:XP_762988.1 hypothetical protein [Theileria parva strain Muguga]
MKPWGARFMVYLLTWKFVASKLEHNNLELHPSRLKIYTLDDDGVPVEDKTKFTVTSDGMIYTFRLNDGVRCTEVKFDESTLWKTEENDLKQPKSVLIGTYNNTITIELSNNSNLVYNFDPVHKIFYSERGQFLPSVNFISSLSDEKQQHTRRNEVFITPTQKLTTPRAYCHDESNDSDLENSTPIVIDITTKGSAYEFDFFKSGKNSIYSAKRGFSIKLVKKSNEIIWKSTKPSDYASKVNVLDTDKGNIVTVHLSYEKTRQYYKCSNQWVEKGLVVIDINKTESTASFHYSKYKNYTTYIARNNFFISSVKEGESTFSPNINIFQAKDASEYLSSVMVHSSGKMTLYFANGNMKHFYKKNRNQWYERKPELSLDIRTKENQYEFGYSEDNNVGTYFPKYNFEFKVVKQGDNVIFKTVANEYIEKVISDGMSSGSSKNLSIYFSNGDVKFFHRSGDEWTRRPSEITLNIKKKEGTFEYDCFNKDSIYIFIPKHNFMFKRIVQGDGNLVDIWVSNDQEYCNKVVLSHVESGKNLSLQLIDGNFKNFYNDKRKEKLWVETSKTDFVIRESLITLDLDDAETTKHYYFYFDDRSNAGVFMSREGYLFNKVIQSSLFSNTVNLWETNNSSIFSNRVVVYNVYEKEVILDIYLVNGNKLHFDIKYEIKFLSKRSWLERKSYLPVSEHPKGVTVLLMDSANPNNLISNDTTKYVVSVNKINDAKHDFPDKISYDYRFKEEARCVEFKVDHKTVWKYDPDAHESVPMSIYLHKFMKLAFVEFNLHSLDIYSYVDGEWKLSFNNKLKGIKIDIQTMKSTNVYYFYIDEETNTGIYVPKEGYFFRKIKQSGSWHSPSTMNVWETFHYYKYSNAIVVYNVDKVRSIVVVHHIDGNKSYLSVEMNYRLISMFEAKTYNLHVSQYPENIQVLTENNAIDYLVDVTVLHKTDEENRVIYEYVFKGDRCLEFKIDDQLVWKYYSSEDRFPKSIYYHKNVEIVLIEFNNHSFTVYKHSENRWKMKSIISTFCDRVIISTLDANGDVVENDTSKYNIDKSDKFISKYIFNDDAKCVGLNFRNNKIWQYEGGDYPKVFYIHNYFITLYIEFSNDYFYSYRFSLQENRMKFEFLRNIRRINYEKIRLITQGADYQVKRYDFAYEFEFKEGCNCLEFLYDDKSMWKYDGQYPILIYFISNFDLQIKFRNETEYISSDSKIKWKMPGPSELDIEKSYSTEEFGFYINGDVGVYESKPNHAANIVKYGNLKLWEASDPTLFVKKVVIDGIYNLNKNIEIFLNNGSVKQFHKMGKKWLSSTAIVLDIDINSNNDLFEYKSTRGFGHFIPKPNLTIGRIVKKNLDIWWAYPNDHAVQVVLMGSGPDDKYISILLQSGNFVLLQKPDHGVFWEDITRRRNFSGIKMYSFDEGKSRYRELTRDDYDPTVFESTYGYEFKDGVKCVKIINHDKVLWTYIDDPEFGYVMGIYLDLISNTFLVKNQSFDIKNLVTQVTQITKISELIKVTLDIENKQTTSEFEYKNHNGNFTYTPKPGYVFNKVIQGDMIFWESKYVSGTKVRTKVKDNKRYLIILLSDNTFKLFEQSGENNWRWADTTNTRYDVTRFKFYGDNDTTLTQSDYKVNIVDLSLSHIFIDGVTCKKIKYGDDVIWKHTDDPNYSTIKMFSIGLASNSLYAVKSETDFKKLDYKTPIQTPNIPVMHATQVTLDISKTQTTDPFEYSIKDDFGTYKPKPGYAISVVKCGTEELWRTNDPTFFVDKVVVNGVRLLSLNDVKLYLANGDVKRFIKVNHRWIDKENPLTLNIDALPDNNYFNYSNNSDAITFTPKHELFINSVIANDEVIWETKKTIEYATKVTIKGFNSTPKILIIQMVRGDEIVFNYGYDNKWEKVGHEGDNESVYPERVTTDDSPEQKMATATYPETPTIQHYQLNQPPSNYSSQIQAKDRFDNWYNYTKTNLAVRTNTPNTTQIE